jgi:endonuclease YncB( thermonuclease family)
LELIDDGQVEHDCDPGLVRLKRMRASSTTTTSHFRWAASLLLVLASGCAENPPEASQRPASEPLQAASTPENQSAPSASVTGKVVVVKDGDTIVVLKDQEQITVRLEGIDCPESAQAFGAKAKQTASDLCFGGQVTLKTNGKDRYGRTLANVILPDGKSLNEQLVRSGYAWWYRKYSKDKTLQRLEADARKNKRGLWSDAKPIAPWDWRAARRAKSDVLPSDVKVVPNGVKIVALLPNPNGTDAGNEQVTIRNSTGDPVKLQGWKLIDKAGNVYLLSGSVQPGKSLVVTMTEATMPLNNNGDTVVLIDSKGVGRSRVSYSGSQARSGAVVRIGQ